MATEINRGGRGRKSENPSYCRDDSQREQATRHNSAEGSARLRDAMLLYFGRKAREWRVDLPTAIRIVEAMGRAGMDGYQRVRKAA